LFVAKAWFVCIVLLDLFICLGLPGWMGCCTGGVLQAMELAALVLASTLLGLFFVTNKIVAKNS
jgi:hypothetical protein